MTRRKKFAVAGIAVALILAAGFVAVAALRGESMREKFNRLREGMTYDEVVAVLGNAPEREQPGHFFPGKLSTWTDRHEAICVSFDPTNRVKVTQICTIQPAGFLDRLRSWFGL